jgi:hypothetical protein
VYWEEMPLLQRGSRKRIKAFVRLLLFSGLRIRDAVTIEFNRFDSDGKILLYTQKTGQPV